MSLHRKGQCNHTLRCLHLKAQFSMATTTHWQFIPHLGAWAQTFSFPTASGQRSGLQIQLVTVEQVGVGVAPSFTPNTPSGVKQGEVAIQGLR